jgi:serpin B
VLHFEENIEETLSATNLLNDELSARQRDADDERGLAPIRINTANAIWAQDGFKIFDDFLNLSRVHLDASVHLLDFISAPERSRLLINDWVSHKTEDRVNHLLPERSISSLTRLVLTNAVHFQAPWAFPFEEHLTSEQPFVTLAGEELDVPMMNQTKVFEVAERDGVQALTMPFRDGQLAMTLLMPTEGDLSQLEDELTPELWSKIRDDQERVKRRIFIPKFKFEFNIKLNSFLKDQGLEVLFNQPDFSGISDQALLVSQVLQKTFIEVAEEGAEAAAATAILIEDGAAPGPVAEPPQELRFDHAFLFAIHDIETGAILFMGRLSDPR